MTIKVALLSGVTSVGEFNGPNSGLVQANSDGTFTIDPRDASYALHAGYVPVYTDTRQATFSLAPTIATVGQIVASASLANGSLSIAHQPDVPRGAQMVVAPGSPGITAGTCTFVYNANDGTVGQTDVLSLVTAANTNFTTPLTKGVLTLTSVTVAGLSGGGSPGINVDTNATLAVPLPPLTVDITLIKEDTDAGDSATLGTLTTAGLWKPHTAPNSTHTFQAWYSTVAP